jgi:hypothetical protein
LRESKARSQYKADDGMLHEEERDVTKYWSECAVDIAIYGMENQHKPERLMPVRVIGYDGASYRSQILEKRTKIIPVVTIVLYFGTEERWNAPTNLKAVLQIPEGLDAYVNDYQIHVFEIAWLTDEEIARFHSDFRIVANYFAQIRRDRNYRPDDPTEIKHVDAVLKLLGVMTGDPKFTMISPKEVKSMYGTASRLFDEGRQSVIVTMLQNGKTVDQIVEFCGFPLEEVQEVENKLLESASVN